MARRFASARADQVPPPPHLVCKLLPHQVDSLRWLKDRESGEGLKHGGLLADDMGLGKTVQMRKSSIASYLHVRLRALLTRALVISASRLDSLETVRRGRGERQEFENDIDRRTRRTPRAVEA